MANPGQIRGPSRRAVLGGMAVLGVAGSQGGTAAAAAKAATSVPDATVSPDGVMHIPAHDIPMPASISPQARAQLIQTANRPPLPPMGTDPAAVRRRVAAFNSTVGGLLAQSAPALRTTVETRTMGGVTVYVSARNEASSKEREKINLYLHGGAFIYGAGAPTKHIGQAMARTYGGTVISVDYRMPPDHPFPAAPDDCLAVYRAVLERYGPEKLLVSGESAGGNLAAVLMLKARDAGLPPPKALFLNTPVTDFETPGDSRSVNAFVDVVLKGGAVDDVAPYIAGVDPANPYLSPLKGDLSRGFPPTYLRTGTRDLLQSDTVRMHAALRKAGVDADLYVGEGMPHGGFLFSDVPEQRDAEADLRKWLDRHWTS